MLGDDSHFASSSQAQGAGSGRGSGPGLGAQAQGSALELGLRGSGWVLGVKGPEHAMAG